MSWQTPADFHQRLHRARQRDQQEQLRLMRLSLLFVAMALAAVMCSSCFADSIIAPKAPCDQPPGKTLVQVDTLYYRTGQIGYICFWR